MDLHLPRRDLFSSLLLLNLSFSLLASATKTQSFDFSSFTLRNLTLLGDSYLQNGSVGLTRQLDVPTSSSGSVICNTPIVFFDSETNVSASFSTKFSFIISNLNPESYGDGITFFLSPHNNTLGDSGGYLGLFNSSDFAKNKFIAIEFDTRQDAEFDDPNSNHIGLNIGSEGLRSIKTADCNSIGIDLKSSSLITAWIDYSNEQKKLSVSLGYSSVKPEKPLLCVISDLSRYFTEIMFAGFSASTEGSTELHMIEDWSFQAFGFRPLNLTPQPHNASDASWALNTLIPAFPVRNSNCKLCKKVKLGVGIGGAIFLSIILSVTFGWISVKKWKKSRTSRSFEFDMVKGPRQFAYKELRDSTKGFHSSREVGHGSFGTVYKAMFAESGNTFAVKRSKPTTKHKTEFLAELTIMAGLRHRNLVQLQGWCVEKNELLLVYEYMPNGSLDKVLYQDSEVGTVLKWAHRYNIVIGIASVLTYLHQECEKLVIHRDIKTSNVMLDASFNPKLGDFGLARLMDHDKSPFSTLPAGTMGYLAPEYLQYGKATEKTDVFSFGIVVLEVACGRRPIENGMINLVDWVWSLYAGDSIMEAVDPRLNGEFEEDEMRRLLLLGLSCVNPDCTGRPTMRKVLQILKTEAELLVVPMKKPILTFSGSLSLSIQDIVSDSEQRTMKSSPLNDEQKAQ